MTRTQVWRVLRELAMKFKRRSRNSMLIDSEDIVAWRHRYLTDIIRYRADGWNIFYTDETCCNAGHTLAKVWIDETV